MADNRNKASAEQTFTDNISETLQLNCNRNFDTFVVAPCNQAVYNAAVAVAENPAETYNPLFIHGEKYLGKTHLLFAIGNQLLLNNPKMKLCYSTAGKFTAEMNNSIRQNFGNIDVLLLDDFQHVEGKDTAQDILSQLLDYLYVSDKQIVITSDKLPKGLAGINIKLLALIERGLIVSIQPLDME